MLSFNNECVQHQHYCLIGDKNSLYQMKINNFYMRMISLSYKKHEENKKENVH